MALPPLATEADLLGRNIALPSADGADINVKAILDGASSAIRDAAGCAILETTSTVTLVTSDPYELDLPAGPVTDVAELVVDGATLTGWRKVGDTVYLPRNWTTRLPAEITVTYTHGLPEVPADIVDLVCALAAMAISDATDGKYGTAVLLSRIQLGDYSESYSRPAGSDSASRLTVPKSVREALRARFGTSTVTIRTNR